MNVLAQALSEVPFLVLDGGLATLLEAMGHDITQGGLWSARLLQHDAAAVQNAHETFFAVGADVAITCSYQASVARLVEERHAATDAEAIALIDKSVALARAAANASGPSPLPKRLVFGSCGCYGASLTGGLEYSGRYMDDTPADDVVAFHEPRFRALAQNADVDAVLFETFPSLKEAKLVVTYGATVFPQTPVIVSFTCKPGACIADGTAFDECLRWGWSQPNVVGIGINCSEPYVVDAVLDVLLATSNAVKDTEPAPKPFLLYPNDGGEWDGVSKTWHAPKQGGSFVEALPEWVRKLDPYRERFGLAVGGCCRVTPDAIKLVAELRRSMQ